MKQILIILILVTARAVGQNYWTIQDNDHPDKKHKKYPSYIEIDTTIVKDPNNVVVVYNSELIKPEGNRFYLPTKPFITITEFSVNLTKEGQSDLDKLEAPTITTDDFNKAHSQDFFKFYTKRDTVSIGDNYEAYVVIDSSKIKNPDKITVLFYSVPLPRTGTKFKILYKPVMEGPNNFEITIINNENKVPESVKFTHSVFVRRARKTPSPDYVVLPEKKPEFRSKEFRSFDDYLLNAIKAAKIHIEGKLILSYTVMLDGSTRFESLKSANINQGDLEKTESIVKSYSGWIPGEDKGKKVNVNIYAVYDFK
jgi:hypothetical protein